jgi:hypothetical protein
MSGHVAQTPISWGRRRSLLGSLWINRPGSKAEERFFERVGHWKELAQEFLIELYTLRRVTNSVNQLYYEGLQHPGQKRENHLFWYEWPRHVSRRAL